MNTLSKDNYFLISIGAVPGAIFRWQVNETFVVNLIGCFLLGFINSLPISRKYKLVFGFGFCGSLTTFSGWSSQLYELFTRGLYKEFFLNSIIVVLIGIFAVGLGDLFGKKITNYLVK
tara:strand:+ start:36 stop:389 length:354 start_codon:yes stop_codon:yes gene_type:complete